jgi:hypothetical protein
MFYRRPPLSGHFTVLFRHCQVGKNQSTRVMENQPNPVNPEVDGQARKVFPGLLKRKLPTSQGLSVLKQSCVTLSP